MMKTIFASVLLALSLSGTAQAQTTKELAYTLAELVVDETFKDVRPLIIGAFDNLEKTALASGKGDRSVSIFIEEMKNAFNRENFIRVIAEVWQREMTLQELQEAQAFLNSSTGRKFRNVSNSMKDPRALAPIFQEACSRARSRIQAISGSTAELDKACARF